EDINLQNGSASVKQKKNKSHRRKRPIPLGISDHDSHILTRVRKQAYRLEWEFSLFGLSVGWTAVFGVIPILGDLLKLWTSYQLIRQCDRIEGGLTNAIRGQMAINMVIDFVIGITPILGTFADALYKANSRNSILLEEILIRRGAENLAMGASRISEFEDSAIKQL
ncbi:hypothetical protein NADFUDRAFT_27170, partial [Nadsonia fulvescens var. elongata DSM 6958]